MQRLVLVTSMFALGACDDNAKDAEANKATDKKSAEKQETPAKAEPKPLPPAPEGTVPIDGLFVHTCTETHPCPQLMHEYGQAHCEGLKTGSMTWRLPSLKELESWRGNEALEGMDAMHWTGTPWEEDAGQIWIYHPGTGDKTTAPPDRKPFTIRCVAKPG